MASMHTVLILLSFLGKTSAGDKKGVSAWASGLLCDDFKVLNNMSWWYDWKNDLTTYDAHVTHVCPTSNNVMPQFVPMVWKAKWDNRTRLSIPGDAPFILVYNEPDMPEQANLTPQQVADIWHDVEQHSHGRPLISPSTAMGDIHWYDEFFRLCKGCRVDYVAAHAYSCDANRIMAYLEKLYHRYNKKIWLTEFACPHSNDDQQQLHLMKTLLPKLEAADYVFRYSWFMARVKRVFDAGFIQPAASLLHNDSSTLTRIGHFYNNFQGHVHNTQVVG